MAWQSLSVVVSSASALARTCTFCEFLIGMFVTNAAPSSLCRGKGANACAAESTAPLVVSKPLSGPLVDGAERRSAKFAFAAARAEERMAQRSTTQVCGVRFVCEVCSCSPKTFQARSLASSLHASPPHSAQIFAWQHYWFETASGMTPERELTCCMEPTLRDLPMSEIGRCRIRFLHRRSDTSLSPRTKPQRSRCDPRPRQIPVWGPRSGEGTQPWMLTRAQMRGSGWHCRG